MNNTTEIQGNVPIINRVPAHFREPPVLTEDLS